MAQLNLRVVDLYRGDKVENLQKAADFGIWGVIHRATWGTDDDDAKQYRAVREAAQKAGLLWGAYHFGTKQDVPTQVKKFLDLAKPDKDTLVALDYEQSNTHPELKMQLTHARDFMQRIADKLGRKPVIYSGHNLKEDLGSKVDAFFGSHRLWLADYRKNWSVQKSWKTYWLRQYTDNKNKNPPNQVPGIPGDSKGNLDCNTYESTREKLAAEWAS
ncbi:MAG TPA: glycoside hydrolase family 25 protein [Xanthobacteraceae bacterium]|nr:glycoside hydrolase family 25 protein [Xanthobacteraceae bacterium]